jgi:hypothetical protein
MQNETPATAAIIMKMTAKVPCKFVTFSLHRMVAPVTAGSPDEVSAESLAKEEASGVSNDGAK